jgi:hypothetical protein
MQSLGLGLGLGLGLPDLTFANCIVVGFRQQIRVACRG